jgi:murein L,D-transpeptidase YcbB/YkuD
MMQFRHIALLCLIAISVCPVSGPVATARAGSPSEFSLHLETLLASDTLDIDGIEILTLKILREVYRDHLWRPFWNRPERIQELVALIGNAADHGLNPADYNAALIAQLADALSQPAAAPLSAEQDILMTESLHRYGYHRRFGKVKASALDPDINYRRERFGTQSPYSTIEGAMESSSLADFIQTMAPSGPVYRTLQQVLHKYRQLAANGGWPAVPPGPTLHPGDRDPRVDTIRARLAVTGEFSPAPEGEPGYFDEALKLAVMDFQSDHALEIDGVVGKNTIEAMNVPVGQRIDQLRLSLERLRWVNQEAASTLVAVNIAGFRVFFYRDGELAWTRRAMVGKYYRQTPVFRGDITQLEFNPTWTIPPSILRNDTLPAIKADPNYLASERIKVFDSTGQAIDPTSVDWNRYTTGVPFTLRQEPGPENSLGRVKFIFPNPHFVFLHDTPHRELFAKAERAFSSGCIRIEDPLSLAELVLDDPVNYPLSKLQRIVESRETTRVVLQNSVPVLIIYLTASVDPDGEVRFYKDIYQRDQKVLDALNGPVVIDVPE